jgi:signal transduction histidine kinase
VSRVVGVDTVQLTRYHPDGTAEWVGAWGFDLEELASDRRFRTGEHNVATLVLQTGRPARIDDSDLITGPIGPVARRLGMRAAAGGPIVVDGRLWGAMVAGSRRPGPMPADIEQRLAGFTELVATAISNAQARAELAASRARLVAAADETRRRIERNLHDGTQQRIVTLALKVRGVRDAVSPALPALGAELAEVEEDLSALLEEVREIGRGLHPAILSHGGLGPALEVLAGHSALPVELDVRAPQSLPEPVEVAAYYVVAEALANAVKYASASVARVDIEEDAGALRLRIEDDGVGGADPAGGSGLIGLSDRVESLGGTISVTSPHGEGTTVVVELPL